MRSGDDSPAERPSPRLRRISRRPGFIGTVFFGTVFFGAVFFGAVFRRGAEFRRAPRVRPWRTVTIERT
ncbi:hypothetical protein GCM10009675_05780 [Prauserella alba]|uniref:Uncharacterized protein n=1 Tax=Prauserella alba TaxID=176898 RepID=A0ABN1V486_9PSEU